MVNSISEKILIILIYGTHFVLINYNHSVTFKLNKMKNPNSIYGNANVLKRMFKQFCSKIISVFEPEEVEVTFKEHGNRTSYTYTKVARKQVA